MPKLICISGMSKDEEYQIHEGENSIGRSDSNDVCVIDKKSSRKHCVITLNDDLLTLVDLDSTNGVRVNNVFVSSQVDLVSGDHVRIGQTVYLISDKISKNKADNLSNTEKVRKQKKYNNLLQQTSFQMTQTSNLRKLKAESEKKETGFIAYFKKDEESE